MDTSYLSHPENLIQKALKPPDPSETAIRILEISYLDPDKNYGKEFISRNDPESPTRDQERDFIDPEKKYRSSRDD